MHVYLIRVTLLERVEALAVKITVGGAEAVGRVGDVLGVAQAREEKLQFP